MWSMTCGHKSHKLMLQNPRHRLRVLLCFAMFGTALLYPQLSRLFHSYWNSKWNRPETRGGYSLYEGYYICVVISNPFFRSLENLYSFDPYIWAKMRRKKMSKFGEMYRFHPLCCLSQRFESTGGAEYPYPKLNREPFLPVVVVSFISNRIQQWNNTRKKTLYRYP